MSIAVVSLTKNALRNAIWLRSRMLSEADRIDIYAPGKLKAEAKGEFIRYYEEKFSETVQQIYAKYEHLIFIMATGIVVRSLAPLLKDKTLDPAVVVMDEKLEYAISLVGGHVAGANELARKIAEVSGARAVVTTATDVNGAGALDLIARDLEAYRQEQRDLYKEANLALAEGDKIFLCLDEYVAQESLDIRGFTMVDPAKGVDAVWEEMDSCPQAIRLYIGITDLLPELNRTTWEKVVPKKLVLGMGCKKNTDYQVLREVFDEFIRNNRFDRSAIREIVSIDLKKEEEALLRLSSELGVSFHTYTAEEIGKVFEREERFGQSAFVKSITGVPAVAEPCAYLASGGHLIVKRYAKNGVTIAAGYAMDR